MSRSKEGARTATPARRATRRQESAETGDSAVTIRRYRFGRGRGKRMEPSGSGVIGLATVAKPAKRRGGMDSRAVNGWRQRHDESWRSRKQCKQVERPSPYGGYRVKRLMETEKPLLGNGCNGDVGPAEEVLGHKGHRHLPVWRADCRRRCACVGLPNEEGE
jgi:hypothetical protein